MGNTASLTIVFRSRRPSGVGVLQALLRSGWELGGKGEIQFLLDEARTGGPPPEYQAAPTADAGRVFEKLGRAEAGGTAWSVLVAIGDPKARCVFTFGKTGDRFELLWLHREELARLGPWSVTDASSCIRAVLPALEQFAPDVLSIEWTEELS
jgi:hypothetical protein